ASVVSALSGALVARERNEREIARSRPMLYSEKREHGLPALLKLAIRPGATPQIRQRRANLLRRLRTRKGETPAVSLALEAVPHGRNVVLRLFGDRAEALPKGHVNTANQRLFGSVQIVEHGNESFPFTSPKGTEAVLFPIVVDESWLFLRGLRSRES